MVNSAVLLYLIIPFLLSIVTFYIFKKQVRGGTFRQAIGASVGGLLISAALIAATFYISIGSQLADVEILNGEVTGKARVHDSYREAYECNCRIVSNCTGSSSNRTCSSDRVCDTCYRDRYTVTWKCHSNVGSVVIEHLDRPSRSVYLTPNPKRYEEIQIGEPFAKESAYVNYIKAVPDSLFRPAQEELKQRFQNQIPAYPGNVFDFYRIDRVIPVGLNVPDIKEWNDAVSNALKKVGPKRQANIVIVLTNISDPSYFYALQDAWVNGKKNDIVIVIGAPEFPDRAAWVNVMALSQDSIFQIKLRDRIKTLDNLTLESVVGNIKEEVLATYTRKEMADFAYLEAEIDPPFWLMALLTVINILAYAGFWYYNVTHNNRNRYNRHGIPRIVIRH